MAYAIMKGLVQRLRQADRKIESLALMDVYGRVARALLEFAVPDKDGLMSIRDRQHLSVQFSPNAIERRQHLLVVGAASAVFSWTRPYISNMALMT